MFLIIKHGFDSMENELGSARYTSIIGCIENELDADAWIASQDIQQYKGWDGNMYPYYTKKKVERVNI
jgi:hypothetical protein